MSTSLSSPVTGRLLDGRYEVGRLIARGGMATVYEAVDTRLDRVVAVKVMHPALAADADFVARFIREARSAARLSHPHVVAVYDQGSDGDTVYLAMEYVPGATLRDLLRMRGRLDADQALAIFEQVLEALAAAHKAGLVHRDVKPENILITDDGRVKVADFGLARAVSTGATNTVTTGVLIGTVSYLAPEQVERSVADARSDVYAAGIMLFEMLTGDKPYTGGSPMEIAFRHVHERVPAPSTRVPGVPSDVDTIVTRATARDPDDRPRDAGELLVAVTRARRGQTSVLEPMPPGVEPTLRHEGIPATSHTLVVGRPPAPPPGAALIPVPLTTDPLVGGEVVERIPPSLRRNRRRGWLIFLVVLLLGALAAGAGWWYADGRFTVTPSVPSGTARSAAENLITDAGLDVAWDEAFSEDIAAGLVVSTDPGAGERILSGGTVTVSLSKGQERYVIPDLARTTEREAERALDDQPLVLGDPVEEFSDTVEDGLVIRTEPAAGERVKRDTEVVLVLSKGREPLDIPTVEGKPVAEAKQALTDAGFTPVEDEAQFNDTVPAGTVISQSVKGTQGFRGDEIHLVVSKGPELIEVPDVTDKSEGAARQILTDAGFLVEVDYPLGNAFIDRVVGQSEDPGTTIPKGSTITLQVV